MKPGEGLEGWVVERVEFNLLLVVPRVLVESDVRLVARRVG